MQFSKTIIALSLAALSMAMPSILSDISSSVDSVLSDISSGGCDISKCIAAAAPVGVSCASALAAEVVNPFSDAACLASLGNDIANVPAACQTCI